jgi:dynein heavy chain
MIEVALFSGDWVLLQNCHLFRSWMNTLESICASLIDREKEIHTGFRLILTSMPYPEFPSTVL